MSYPFVVSYILGFDGGGTKTECVLMDASNRVVARSVAGPSNPFRIGVEAAVRAVKEAANLALHEAKLNREVVGAIGAGLAGTSNSDLHQRTLKGIQGVFPGVHVKLVTDLEAALAAAGSGPRIVLVAGTGSAAIGCNASHEVYRAGGWGRFSSDEGSAFDVGRKAITSATSHANGISSVLRQQILSNLACTDWSEVQRRAEVTPDDVFPRIFPVIAAAADAGDAAARNLLLAAISELCSLIADVADHLHLRDTEFTLVKTGGMIGRSDFFDSQLDNTVRACLPQAHMAGLRISPAEAAALAAKE